MEKSTPTPDPSSPPAFMQKVEDAQSKAEKTVAKEEAAQADDEFAIRTATIVKATEKTGDTAEFLARIDAKIAAILPEFIAKHSLGQTLDLFVALEDEAAKLEKQTKSIMARLAYAREVSFPARLDAEDTQTTTSKDTGHRMSRTARVFASIITDPTGKMLERAYAWLRENNLGPLIKETVNSSSLSAAAKELIENGRELPDDIFTTHTKDGVSITRKKAK